MCESTSAFTCRSMREYYKAMQEAGEWAEGPATFDIVSKEEYQEFCPSSRDRVMEAYENGNGNSIYV